VINEIFNALFSSNYLLKEPQSSTKVTHGAGMQELIVSGWAHSNQNDSIMFV